MEDASDAAILSKDRLLFAADEASRNGQTTDYEDLRARSAERVDGHLVVLDETVRPGSLDCFVARGFEITGIYINTPFELRRRRLERRIERQLSILQKLSELVDRDLLNMDREERRLLWRGTFAQEKVDTGKRAEFEDVLRQMYLTGSHWMKPDAPDPIRFKEVEYIVELDGDEDLTQISVETLLAQRVSRKEYEARWRSRIEFVLWDVGGVIYDFDKGPLYSYIKQARKDPIEDSDLAKLVDFKAYMRGVISFEDFCADIAAKTAIEGASGLVEKVAAALRAGKRQPRELVASLMRRAEAAGLTSCVLSNALPVLLEEEPYLASIEPKNRFYSFDSGYLKPEPESYTYVLDSLGCSPRSIIFVDDKLRNVEAAQMIGMTGIHFNEATLAQEMSDLYPGLGG
ncbi:MAG: HAD-IA family hydrolase [Pseudomonadota bacterium]